jgi:hypothetical protein
MRTRADLVNRAAKFLGKLVAGQALADEDYASINDEIPSIVENLNARGIAYIPDVEEYEEAIFLPLARIVAAIVAPDFSVPLNTLSNFVGPTPDTTEPRKSEIELRVLGRGPNSPETVIPFQNF